GAPPLARSARRLRSSGMRTRPGRGDHRCREAERERGNAFDTEGGRKHRSDSLVRPVATRSGSQAAKEDKGMSAEVVTHPAVGAEDRRRWLALGVIVTAQFMVVLDISIVNVALPSIKTDLHFSQESLQWVITAYSIFFGGFLLLGGWLAAAALWACCSAAS